ncbi:protein LONGIFOLIA 2 [Sesamum indicum]|uniref:Protein LONGIFOLIA 2 n=1 Tax=Sesamum indicum TaxID=4182 RepID=A0A6I9TWF2_SESIN|nr:protein LONGIFOLIA 2 [Sesamum indicum]
MSAKILPSSRHENRNSRKQIRCMNSIFHLFDRHHLLAGWKMSSHNHKRLLPGPQQELEPNKLKAVTDVQKEKPRVYMETSQASLSSSSCAFASSSLDYNRTAEPETLPLGQINISESPLQITAMIEQQPSSTRGLQSPDIRDVVKDSMYREARSLTIKSVANDERKVTVMKHIDSPRPLQQSKFGKPKAPVYEGSTRVFPKVLEGTKNSKDELLTLPRFSYDGRESRDSFKTAMKLKERPRLSLDSKASSFKSSALESRLNFVGQDMHIGNKNSSHQEPGSHTRTSSIIAKLMGLDAFPDTISTDENPVTNIKSSPSPRVASPSKLSTKAEESKQNQVSFSQPGLEKNPASSSPRSRNASSIRKPTTCSRLPMEPAPWKQRDSCQVSPKVAAQSRKTPTNTLPSSSVYGEIEKRITELEFKRSGKDLRALKQILEAMQKTRARLENQRGESAELTMQQRCTSDDSCSNQNSKLPMSRNRKAYQQALTINGTCSPKQSGSSVGTTKSATVMEKFKILSSNQVPTTETSHLRRLRIQEPKYHKENTANREKAKDLTPGNHSTKDSSLFLPSIDKTKWRNLELERTVKVPPRIRAENCSTSGRGFLTVSPRLQQNALRIEGETHPTTALSDSGRLKKHSSKKIREKSSQYRKHKVKSMDSQLCDDQLSDLSSETRYSSYQGDTASVKSESNNSIASQMETEVKSSAGINTNYREQQNSMSTLKDQIPAFELAATMMEQPSPVSVLDATFYSEDSPSPVKKRSTAFQEDESPSPDEAEWPLGNVNQLPDCTRPDPGYNYSQKSENILRLVHEPRLLKTKPSEAAANYNESVDQSLNPGQRYINKILLASGLLKDTGIIPAVDQLLSCHLIDPDIFHAVEEKEDRIEEPTGEFDEKNDQMKLNQKIQKKIIFDTLNEILVRKFTSGGLFTLGWKKMSSQGLMKEVYLEMDQLCNISSSNLDDEDDGFVRLLASDMKNQSEDWTDYSGELPALVLDIERLIFKDLINEVVTGEVMDLQEWSKRHCRQLFTK